MFSYNDKEFNTERYEELKKTWRSITKLFYQTNDLYCDFEDFSMKAFDDYMREKHGHLLNLPTPESDRHLT